MMDNFSGLRSSTFSLCSAVVILALTAVFPPQSVQWTHLQEVLLLNVVASAPAAFITILEFYDKSKMNGSEAIGKNVFSKRLLKAVPIFVILLPDFIVLVTKNVSFHLMLSVTIVQMILSSESLLISRISSTLTEKNESLHLINAFHGSISIFNVSGFMCLWICNCFFPESKFVIEIMGACLHGCTAVVTISHETFVAYVAWKRENDIGEDEDGDLTVPAKMKSLSWESLVYAAFVLGIWVVHFLYEMNDATNKLMTVIEGYLYVIILIPVAITVFRGRSLRERLESSKTVAAMNSTFVRYISHEMLSHIRCGYLQFCGRCCYSSHNSH